VRLNGGLNRTSSGGLNARLNGRLPLNGTYAPACVIRFPSLKLAISNFKSAISNFFAGVPSIGTGLPISGRVEARLPLSSRTDVPAYVSHFSSLKLDVSNFKSAISKFLTGFPGIATDCPFSVVLNFLQ